jgi:hypothetical protein
VHLGLLGSVAKLMRACPTGLATSSKLASPGFTLVYYDVRSLRVAESWHAHTTKRPAPRGIKT